MGAYVTTERAIEILRCDGKFTENQARLVLLQTLKVDINGAEFFPIAYLLQRSKKNTRNKKR